MFNNSISFPEKLSKSQLLLITLQFVILILIFNSNNYGQEKCVIFLKNGEEIIGEAFLDSTKNIVVIKTLDDLTRRISYDDIISDQKGKLITTYQNVKIAPTRIELPPGVDTCRIRGIFYWELRGVGMYSGNISYGGETAVGIRINKFLLGVGGGALYIKDVWRIPVYLHLKYEFTQECINPFLVVDAGYIFDQVGSDYNLKPAVNKILKPSPKFAGIGLGIDIPMAKWIDFSIDAGYRYLTIAERKFSQSCNGDIPALGFTETHNVYMRIGITF